jgi:hypothetical protein
MDIVIMNPSAPPSREALGTYSTNKIGVWHKDL